MAGFSNKNDVGKTEFSKKSKLIKESFPQKKLI